jgi:glutamine synthetase
LTCPASGNTSRSPSKTCPKIFDEGIGFDGSSIRGFQQIQESDMILVAGTQIALGT